MAPTQWSVPRASAGFNRFPASMLPSAAPAPTIVWSSSMKRISLPSAFPSAFKTFFSRSSNSPRYFAPATSAARSRPRTFFPCRDSGISCLKILWASPSTMAVFPTPGSPTRTGLFFVLRDKIWIVRRISSSRPMIGSIFPVSASAV